MIELWQKILLYVAPMYFANSFAMFLGGKTPLDFNKKLADGQPVFGKGKTIKGTVFGMAVGMLVTIIIYLALSEWVMQFTSNYVLLGFLLSIGAISGDLVASFFKRRNKISAGTPVLFLDQLDFVFGGMLFGSIVYAPDFFEIVVVAVLTLAAHKVSNYFAFKTKLKNVPW